MKYFSGFCFKDEYLFFQDNVNIDFSKSDYVVCGFSFGAMRAFEFLLKYNKRIDKLILISPAFFNNTKNNFKQLQLRGFEFDSDKYIKTFLRNIQKPYLDKQTKLYNYLDIPSKQEGLKQLEQMLYYTWDKNKLDILAKRNILLEVYLGVKDSIINTNITKDFFMPYGDIYMINNASHILSND